jgi:hypothetical protein
VNGIGEATSKRCTLNQRKIHSGNIFFFGFSGYILTKNIEQFSDITFRKKSCNFTLRPPIRLSNPTWRPIPQITKDNIHILNSGLKKWPDVYRVNAIPTLCPEKGVGLMVIPNDSKPNNVKNAPDTIYVHARGDIDDRYASRIAATIVNNAFEWLRIASDQWWIGRPGEALTGNLHVQMPADENGNVIDLPRPLCKQYTSSLEMKYVDKDMWEACVRKSIADSQPPPHLSLLSETKFNLHSGQYKYGILSGVSAIEIFRDLILSEGNCDISNMRTNTTDLLKHLTVGFNNLYGRNLQTEMEPSYEFLKSLWICRGNIAHGKPLRWIEGGKEVRFDQSIVARISGGLEAIVRWMQTVRLSAD